MRKLLIVLPIFLLLFTSQVHAGTRVPGHESPRYDQDNNGISDDGVFVNGHYTSIYAYDGNEDYYWDLGDGRVWGTVSSVDDLDEATLTTCDYVINYRADFGNDTYMNEGWIQNLVKCTGMDKGNYNSVIVSQTDPRYTGDPNRAIWGTWEYHVDAWSHWGNILKNGRL